jgi:hypothetical protein
MQTSPSPPFGGRGRPAGAGGGEGRCGMPAIPFTNAAVNFAAFIGYG